MAGYCGNFDRSRPLTDGWRDEMTRDLWRFLTEYAENRDLFRDVSRAVVDGRRGRAVALTVRAIMDYTGETSYFHALARISVADWPSILIRISESECSGR